MTTLIVIAIVDGVVAVASIVAISIIAYKSLHPKDSCVNAEDEPRVIRECLEKVYGPCNAKIVFNPRGNGRDWRAVFTSVVNNLETISCNVFHDISEAKAYCYANGFADNEIEVIEQEKEWRNITEATAVELSMIEAAKMKKKAQTR